MTREDELERLLDEAREASPVERLPTYRDAIAAFGEEAIEPLATWLEEPAFAAFTVRTLGRIAANDPDTREAVAAALLTADRSTMADHIARDLDSALDQLGLSPARRAAVARSRAAGLRAASARPIQNPGVDGRGYWAMRTSPWERPYIWAEARRGRLRQGWGWAAEQNLEVIALAVRAGQPLSDEQQMAWPSRRMMSSEPDGMRPDDLILVPNIPEWGLVCVFHLVGSYAFSPDAPRRFDDRFGHILPVELVAGPISRYDRTVSDALQSTMRNPGRLWNIAPYGGDVERLGGSPCDRPASLGRHRGHRRQDRPRLRPDVSLGQRRTT